MSQPKGEIAQLVVPSTALPSEVLLPSIGRRSQYGVLLPGDPEVESTQLGILLPKKPNKAVERPSRAQVAALTVEGSEQKLLD